MSAPGQEFWLSRLRAPAPQTSWRSTSIPMRRVQPENAQANGFGNCVTAVCANLLDALAPRPLFDVILSSPPKHPGEPRDLADRGWHAGPQYRDFAALFDQARERLKPGGSIYVMLSSDSDLDLLGPLINEAGLGARLVYERSFYIESMILFELRPASQYAGALWPAQSIGIDRHMKSRSRCVGRRLKSACVGPRQIGHQPKVMQVFS
jgi:hypothetical protein